MLIRAGLGLFTDWHASFPYIPTTLLASMDPAKSVEPYRYIEFARFIQANRLCHGKFLTDHGKLYSKLHFSAAIITWVIYDSREHPQYWM